METIFAVLLSFVTSFSVVDDKNENIKEIEIKKNISNSIKTYRHGDEIGGWHQS